MKTEEKIINWLNQKLPNFDFTQGGFTTSINQSIGLIRIIHHDQGSLIPACWNMMAELYHSLMEILDSDIVRIKCDLFCNQYDPNGEEFFSFDIYFEFD